MFSDLRSFGYNFNISKKPTTDKLDESKRKVYDMYGEAGLEGQAGMGGGGGGFHAQDPFDM